MLHLALGHATCSIGVGEVIRVTAGREPGISVMIKSASRPDSLKTARARLVGLTGEPGDPELQQPLPRILPHDPVVAEALALLELLDPVCGLAAKEAVDAV